jgi:hypothetical protein
MPAIAVQANGNRRSGRKDSPFVKGDSAYSICRTFTGPIATNPTDVGRANAFTLANVPDTTDFTNLFDMFTVERVTVTMVLSQAAISAGNSGIFPTLSLALDYNDDTAPTLLTDVLSYANVKVVQFSEAKRTHTFSFKPRVQINASSGTVAMPDVWASTASASTAKWFGYRYWLANYNSTSTTGSLITQYVTFHLKFKVPK